jgi:hypothetical protein
MAEIAIVRPVRAMVVLDPALSSVPVTIVKAGTIVDGCNPVGTNPVGTNIGRARPISLVPAVLPPHWIPISSDPHKIGARTCRYNGNHSGRGWRPDRYSNRYSGAEHCASGQQQ